MFDAVCVPGGAHVSTLKTHGDALHFVNEAYRHGKPLGATSMGKPPAEHSAEYGTAAYK